MNYFAYDVIIDGQSMNARGFYCVKRPNRNAPAKRYEEYEISGRDGTFYKDTGFYEDNTVVVTFNYMDDAEKWQSRYREVMKILYQAQKITFSDDQGGYQKIKKVEIGENERASLRHIGTFEVTFTVDPWFYRDNKISNEPVFRNPYDIAKPIYYIEKIEEETEGILMVNDKEIPFNITDNVTIDSDLEICYYTKTKGNANKCIDCDFEDLWFKNGENVAYITGPFSLSIKADWRELG